MGMAHIKKLMELVTRDSGKMTSSTVKVSSVVLRVQLTQGNISLERRKALENTHIRMAPLTRAVGQTTRSMAMGSSSGLMAKCTSDNGSLVKCPDLVFISTLTTCNTKDSL